MRAGARIPVDPLLREGIITPTTIGGVQYAVARHAQGWCMFVDACTHAACSLSGNGEIVDGVVLVCVCHGAEFDLVTGEVLEGPAEDPLVVHELVAVDGGLRLKECFHER